MFLFLFLGWLGVAMPKMGIRMHSTATLVKLPTPCSKLREPMSQATVLLIVAP